MDQHRDYHSSWSYDASAPPPPYHDGGHYNNGGGFSNSGRYNHHRRYQNQSQDAGPEPTDSYGYSNGTAFTGRKRQYTAHGPPDHFDGGSYGKLYVSNVPREATEEDIRSLFDEYGNITEVILFKQIKNLQQHECCFVKYAKTEDADEAIKALNNQYTFPGRMCSIEVRYASKKQERPGPDNFILLHASLLSLILFPTSKYLKKSGLTMMSTYLGILFARILRFFDSHTLSLNLSLSLCVIGFSKTLENKFLMMHENKVFVGCLNKHASKAEIAEIFSSYGYVEDVFLMLDDQRRSRGTGFITFTDRAMAAAAINGLNGKYVMKGCDQPLIVRFADPKKPKIWENRYAPYPSDPVAQASLPNSSHMSSQTGSEPPASSTCSVPACLDMADPPDCDWSEHICPDGNAYYYNCVTCESLWEKPEEYSFYEQQLENGNQQSPFQHTHCVS